MKVLIIGGDAAGMSAAAKLNRILKDCQIIVYEKGKHLSYASCGLPYFAAGYPIAADDLIQRTAEQFATAGIVTLVEHEVLSVNPIHKTLTVKNLKTGDTFADGYDKLMIATGSSSLIPAVPGADLDGVFYLKSVNDGIALREAVQAKHVKDITVVGGGYIGVEFAEALHASGKRVRMIQRSDTILKNFYPEISAAALNELKRLGVDVRLSEKLLSIEEFKGRKQVVTNAGAYETDVVLLAIGVRPATEFLEDSGIALAKNGAVVIDRQMRTSQPDIYAAGDCAQVYHLLKDENVFIPLATTANKCGRIVGKNLAGGEVEFAGTLGCAAIKVGQLELATVGLTLQEAATVGFDCTAKTIHTQTLPGYYQTDTDAMFRVVYEKGTRRLLGVQGVGKHGIALRIDVFAAAIANSMTADALGMLDLCYAPPFSTVWDAVHIVANAAK
jgi:NADPH-dependent 2,4-dienoyl-CoA reductase/sulfur reductase-like enzyme